MRELQGRYVLLTAGRFEGATDQPVQRAERANVVWSPPPNYHTVLPELAKLLDAEG
jgi:hypothetical protein